MTDVIESLKSLTPSLGEAARVAEQAADAYKIAETAWKLQPDIIALSYVYAASAAVCEIDPEEWELLVDEEFANVFKSARIQPQKSQIAGGVYLLKSNTGHWKIGCSKNFNDRLTTFAVKLPFQVEYEHLIYTNNRHDLERELHRHFSHKRLAGEWFDLSSEDIAYIKGL